MIVGSGNGTDEACFVSQGHGAAVRLERKLTGLDLDTGGFWLLGREPYGDDLGIGEANGGNGYLVPGASFAGDDLSHHLALSHRSMCQHRLARDVSDRVDIAHRGPAPVIDTDERAVHLE